MAIKKITDKRWKVDIVKLGELLKERNSSLPKAAGRIGVCSNYFSQLKYAGGYLDEVKLNLVCDLYGIKKDDIVIVENKNEKPAKTNEGMDNEDFQEFAKQLFKKLDELAALLKEQKVKNTVLSNQEDIVILLQQMLKHGSCREDQFKEKAKQAGYGAELCNYAIDFMECKRDVVSGKVWLKKK